MGVHHAELALILHKIQIRRWEEDEEAGHTYVQICVLFSVHYTSVEQLTRQLGVISSSTTGSLDVNLLDTWPRSHWGHTHFLLNVLGDQPTMKLQNEEKS